MAFNKKGGEKVSKEHAMSLIENYRKEQKDKEHVRSIYYDKEMLQSVLDTPGCVGVRICYAKNAIANTLVLLPVNDQGQPIWSDENARGGFTALNVGNPCPPYC